MPNLLLVAHIRLADVWLALDALSQRQIFLRDLGDPVEILSWWLSVNDHLRREQVLTLFLFIVLFRDGFVSFNSVDRGELVLEPLPHSVKDVHPPRLKIFIWILREHLDRLHVEFIVQGYLDLLLAATRPFLLLAEHDQVFAYLPADLLLTKCYAVVDVSLNLGSPAVKTPGALQRFHFVLVHAQPRLLDTPLDAVERLLVVQH
jgi:hypothetical protein